MAVRDGRICALNLRPLKPGAPIEQFERFSSELDQPTWLTQDVVEGFDA